MASDTILAIDFGTSNSLVGAIHDGKKIGALPLDLFAEDSSLMRTLLYFPNSDLCYYGSEALSEYTKRDMEGRLFRSFKTHLANPNYAGTVIQNRILSIENMVGTFLLELKKRAEIHFGEKIDRAVIGRPARYSMDSVHDEIAKKRMQRACDFAGFTTVRFVPEPLAAAYDYRKNITSEKTVLIGDFGGGTSDFTVVRLKPNSFSKKDVLAVDGCPLAGDSLDSLFMSERLGQFFGSNAVYRLPMSKNLLNVPATLIQRLNHPAHIVHLKEKETYEFIREVRKCAVSPSDAESIERLFTLIDDQQIFAFFEVIENVKRSLSSGDRAQFIFDYPSLEITSTFTKDEFINWAISTRQKIFAALDRCLASAGLKENQIDLVCLTGGTSYVPFIKSEFTQRFGTEKLQMASQFHSVLSGLVESAYLWAQGEEI